MQLHKRLSTNQVKRIVEGYQQGQLGTEECQQLLDVGRSRFFELVGEYREKKKLFVVDYKRSSPSRLPTQTELAIKQCLEEDKRLVDDPDIPITSYNYSAIKDRLQELGYTVSLYTIIERAKQGGYYRPRKPRALHDREVLTGTTGDLVQHDSSLHLWSPYASNKWSLITSLDDYSRLMLYADLFEKESTWAHIEANQAVCLSYGVPLRWYVDQLRTFRFVVSGESFWTEQHLKTDSVNTQWKDCVLASGSQVVYALSPQAKGKIERPYRWLQDRVVRTCARERVSGLEETRQVLKQEVERYNKRQVHSTTGEIPLIRYQRNLSAGLSLFQPLEISPNQSLKDIFCLRMKRSVDSYRKISLQGLSIQLPKVPPHEEVEIHLVPNRKQQTIEVRIWWRERLVFVDLYQRLQFPRVHF